ncbi:MAG: HD domain-containing protein [Cryomorphaceae bacterium]|nr:HD domain-containing protein [Cryomorphaceae bacterium]
MTFSSDSYQKFKTLSDPVYGFIQLPYGLLFDLLEHPYMQRLRRISQTSLTYMVYPGATHNRLHHVIGATHLTRQAILVLRRKGHEITEEEEEAVLAAILLHDIGHGPFSHTLENTLIKVSHEEISLLFMEHLNREFRGKLSLAIEIFANRYGKPFLHQLVSSQLDMDRLDYLRRDSFFTGVSEGMVNTERIISMLNVSDDQLVVDAKGVYSIEKFLVARRIMYWQVYLHKTVLSVEFMLVKLLEWARLLVNKNMLDISAPPALQFFLENEVGLELLRERLDIFAQLDDVDVMSAVKSWTKSSDYVLSDMSSRILNRRLFKVSLQETPFTKQQVSVKRQLVQTKFGLNDWEAKCYVFSGSSENRAYNTDKSSISLRENDGRIIPLSQDAHIMDIQAFSRNFKKYYMCFPQL